MLNHFAYFDCLSICSRVRSSIDNIARTEICLFAYLACLLSLYKNQPASNWGYDFAVTDQAYPYSPQLIEAINSLTDTGCLEVEKHYLKITTLGLEEYNNLLIMSQFSERESYIDGACSSLLALPMGSIQSAVSQEPDIKGAVALSQSRVLFSDSGLDILHEQFAALSSAIGIDVEDLMVPAVVWLTYLFEVKNFEWSESLP